MLSTLTLYNANEYLYTQENKFYILPFSPDSFPRWEGFTNIACFHGNSLYRISPVVPRNKEAPIQPIMIFLRFWCLRFLLWVASGEYFHITTLSCIKLIRSLTYIAIIYFMLDSTLAPYIIWIKKDHMGNTSSWPPMTIITHHVHYR